jgi:hypothetical protein
MKRLTVLLVVLALRLPAFAQNVVGISGSVNWDRMEISADVSIDLGATGIRLPAGRIQAEEAINDGYTSLIRPSLLSLPIDSSSTLEDLLDRDELSMNDVDAISRGARLIPPALSADLSSLSGRYIISLNKISTALIQHRRPADLMHILTPMSTVSYTGIIIIADEELPVHGRYTSALPLPCLFPKIWDTNMNLIYERNMTDPGISKDRPIICYVSSKSIFRPTPSGLDDDLVKIVGPNPLRIIAREVFGMRPTDPVIDRDDALLILSSRQNQQLIREGRVAIVLNEDVLSATF